MYKEEQGNNGTSFFYRMQLYLIIFKIKLRGIERDRKINIHLLDSNLCQMLFI